jgi:hypothetical protein
VIDMKTEEKDHDDDTATIHSRTTAQSGATHTKRRSFFGEMVHKHGSSIAASTEDVQEQLSRSGSRSQDNRSRSGSQHHGPSGDDSITNIKGGGVVRTTSVRDNHSVRSPDRSQVGSPGGHSYSQSHSGGVRDSVMKRLSLFKGVGRKTSRLEIRPETNGVLHEE